jgi:Roadblock/LC7 domain
MLLLAGRGVAAGGGRGGADRPLRRGVQGLGRVAGRGGGRAGTGPRAGGRAPLPARAEGLQRGHERGGRPGLRADPRVVSITGDRPVFLERRCCRTGSTGSRVNSQPRCRGRDGQRERGRGGDRQRHRPHPSGPERGRRVSCAPGRSFGDGNGHGSHVPASLAPATTTSAWSGSPLGARLWAVRVLNAGGVGSFADVICGVDRVTEHAAAIEVANMSRGGTGAEPPGRVRDRGPPARCHLHLGGGRGDLHGGRRQRGRRCRQPRARPMADQLAAVASGVASLSQGAARFFEAGLVTQTVVEMQPGGPVGGCPSATVLPDGAGRRLLRRGVVGYQMRCWSPAPARDSPQPTGRAAGRLPP